MKWQIILNTQSPPIVAFQLHKEGFVVVEVLPVSNFQEIPELVLRLVKQRSSILKIHLENSFSRLNSLPDVLFESGKVKFTPSSQTVDLRVEIAEHIIKDWEDELSFNASEEFQQLNHERLCFIL